MTLHPWTVDWSIAGGCALATRTQSGDIHTCQFLPPTKGTQLASRLWTHRDLVRNAAMDALGPHGWPLAVYVEQPVGKPNPSLYAAYGVTLESLWDVLRQSPFETSIWPVRATEWRQALGLVGPRGGSKVERRLGRKEQQRLCALAAGARPDLSEDEYDAVCMLLAAELEISTEEKAA